MHPVLRVTRSSDNLDELIPFYRDGLGFSILASFRDHDGFDGIILGSANAPYHLEFTKSHRHRAGKAPTQENLLVFYLSDEKNYRDAVKRMRQACFEPVSSFNPYWDKNGTTFEDPDGYRVVLHCGAWNI